MKIRQASSWGRSTQFAVKTTTKKTANATVGNSISEWNGSAGARRRARRQRPVNSGGRRSAKLVMPSVKSLLWNSSMVWSLPRLLGWAKAAEIGFMGKDLSGAEAAEMGLMNKAVPGDELASVAREWADTIAGNAPLAVKAMKRLFRHGLTEDFQSHSHHVLLQTMLLFQSNDFTEGITSFAERRPPEFTGR